MIRTRLQGETPFFPNMLNNGNVEVCLKEDVDKVIVEKDAEIVELKKQVHDYALGSYVIQARAEKEARHDKYKRCMAMTWFCHYIAAWDNEVYVHGGTSDDRLARLYWKWEKRWLELANKYKYKEAK